MHGRPRALVVSPVMPHPPVAGGHKRTLRLMEAIERAGGRPHLVTDEPGPGATRLRERGWLVDVVPREPHGLLGRGRQHLKRLPSPYLEGVAELVRGARREAAVVQFEHTQSTYYLDQASPCPTVFSAHNVDSEMLTSVREAQRPGSIAWMRAWNRSSGTRVWERRATRGADAVICVSDRDASFFSRLARRVVVVPNGVDDELFAVSDHALAEHLLFFGHFGYEPNAAGLRRFLREGWPVVARTLPAARLRVAGLAIPSDLVAEARCAERVDVVGYVEDIGVELERARVVLVPLWQGGGTRLKVLEAMAAARPVVGTPLGVEQVGFRDGEHGIVASQPADLARGAVALLASPDRSAALGRAARSHAELFRWNTVTAPAEALYDEWLSAAK